MHNPILQQLGQGQAQPQAAQAPANNGGDAIAQAAAQAMCGVPRINPYGYQIIPQFGCYNNGGNI